MLYRGACIDTHIDLISATCCGCQGYLHSSPEYGMKRLLSEEMGDIYQLSHVFRDGELGERHHPEFTMVEWYRMGVSFEAMIQETLDFVRLFLAVTTSEEFTYREIFEAFTGHSPEEIEDHDAALAFTIEPQLGKEKLTVIKDFPPEKAALAKTRWNGKEFVAERFEIYYQGIELANGYHELTDPMEQRRRLEASNAERQRLGKSQYPLDEQFLKSLEKGIGDCCGVAVGFDRLMMIRHQVKDIREVLPFTW